MRSGRIVGLVLCVAVLTGSAGCGGGGGGDGGSATQNPNPTAPNPAPTGSVTVGSTAFSPASITVARGSTVTWSWDSCTGGDIYGGQATCVAHNVTFENGAASATQSTGNWSRVFTDAGTFPYHCTIHGAAMSGRVVVQ